MFGGYSYETTLAYFKFTLRNPNDVRNGETRGEWFYRLHKITGGEFAQIVRSRESKAEFLRIMAIKDGINLGMNTKWWKNED